MADMIDPLDEAMKKANKPVIYGSTYAGKENQELVKSSRKYFPIENNRELIQQQAEADALKRKAEAEEKALQEQRKKLLFERARLKFNFLPQRKLMISVRQKLIALAEEKKKKASENLEKGKEAYKYIIKPIEVRTLTDAMPMDREKPPTPSQLPTIYG